MVIDSQATLWAISDLHTGFVGNNAIVDQIRSDNVDDWLIIAGDITEDIDSIITTLAVLRSRFAQVIWVPGNHELYTTARDSYQLFGVARYDRIVTELRSINVITPEDHYPIFTVENMDYRIVPMFLLYDYSFRPKGWEKLSTLEAIGQARNNYVVATDEVLLSPEPYSTKDAWCRARVQYTQERLNNISPDEKTVLINHWPLVIDPCYLLFDPEFSLWCGTCSTHSWHRDYRAVACVYGHLHIPRTTWYDGVRFEEVSIGYPREWQARGLPKPLLRQILPDPQDNDYDLHPLGIRFDFDPERAREARKKHELQRKKMREMIDRNKGLHRQ